MRSTGIRECSELLIARKDASFEKHDDEGQGRIRTHQTGHFSRSAPIAKGEAIKKRQEHIPETTDIRGIVWIQGGKRCNHVNAGVH